MPIHKRWYLRNSIGLQRAAQMAKETGTRPKLGWCEMRLLCELARRDADLN